MKAVCWILLLSALLGCVHTYGSEVKRVREGLIGLHGRDLRFCLPVPEVAPDGEREYLTYRWFPDEDDEETYQYVAAGSGRIRVEEEWPFTRGLREDQKSPYCELVISLRDGIVYDVQAEGRDRRGLNTDAECLLDARRCLPEGE
jgi:hypothetical protein